MLARFKQQVQETGGFLKKQQQVLAGKVTSSKSQGQQQAQKKVKVPDWIDRVRSMGYDRGQIDEALELLGDRSFTAVDLLEVLSTMPQSKAASKRRGSESSTVGSSMTTSSRQEELPPVLSPQRHSNFATTYSNDKAFESTRSRARVPEWMDRVRSMGYDKGQIDEALELLGDRPSTVVELLDVLSTLNESKVASERRGSVSSTVGSSMNTSRENWLFNGSSMDNSMAACGSLEFERSTDKLKLLYSAPEPVPWQAVPRLDNKSFHALQRMGYTYFEILTAVRSLDEDASMDDLFDFLIEHRQKVIVDDPLPKQSNFEEKVIVDNQVPKQSTFEEKVTVYSPVPNQSNFAEKVTVDGSLPKQSNFEVGVEPSVGQTQSPTSSDVLADTNVLELGDVDVLETSSRVLARLVIHSVLVKVAENTSMPHLVALGSNKKEIEGPISPQHGGA